ncbi:TCP-1/cpn60 chaperonin family protein [Bradyrhizobium sp. dw_78]|uniref:TCP-1/cpn60 chaperonin family protein n=1 Tax=Bradyrhizobium sp. dw_78 TaxID=2719793 RepID=UPI001BD37500|nr:TCP-1/cpn60 chaperonin family protein [Bradyrhizobium sp. dw_78]
MMPHKVIMGSKARAVLAESLSHAVRAVVVSLGPAGCAVLRDRGANSVETVHSGGSIARIVADEAGPWSIAPRILGEVLADTERDFGDGTARVACICEAIFASGAQAAAHGVPLGALADALLDLAPRLDELLAAETCDAPPLAALAEAACYDAEIAQALASLDAAVNPHGVIDIRESWKPGIRIQSAAGFVLDVQPEAIGFAATEQVALTMNRASVLIVNDIVDSFGPFARILEQFVAKNRSLVIVARGFGPEARAALLSNRKGLGLNLLGLVPEDVSLRAAAVLEDLAVATGGAVIDDRLGSSLADVRPAMLGQARQVHWSGTRAILSDPAGQPDAIEYRRNELIAEAKKQQYLALDRDHLLRRAARLAGLWAEIQIGAQGGLSSSQRVTRAKAALSVIRHASIAGVVPGGGVALARVGKALEQRARPTSATGASHFAARAVAAGCQAVTYRIAANAGSDGRAAVTLASGPRRDAVAYDASRRASIALRDWPIADPLSITQSILRRAISAAATMLRVEVLVCC